MECEKLFLFTCVKNGENYINTLFESLLKQTDTNFIHYIFDDGSDKPLDPLIEKYEKKVSELGSPYTVIYERSNKNIGLNKATEHCIKMSNPYNYVCWINCDDWVDKNYISEMRKYISKHPNNAVYRSKMIVHYQNHIEERPGTSLQKKLFRKHNQYYVFAGSNFSYNHFVFNKKHLNTINPSTELLSDRGVFNDVQIVFPFIALQYSFAFVKKAVTHYNLLDDSESFSVKEDDLSYKKVLGHLNITSDLPDLYFSIKMFNRCFIIKLEERDYSGAIRELKKRHAFLKLSNLREKYFPVRGKHYYRWLFSLKIRTLLKC